MNLSKIITTVDCGQHATRSSLITMINELKDCVNIDDISRFEAVQLLTGIDAKKIRSYELNHNDFIIILDVYLKIKSETKELWNEFN